MAKNLKNAAPKRYRTNFIEPGLADYTAEGFGKVLVSKDALDKMLQSYVGKPVFLEHNDTDVVEAFNNSEGDSANGVVSAVGYDENSGWFWADMLIWDDETQQCIDEKGYTVSCAYDVLKADGGGGSYHAIPYDQEVIEGEYTHMAIVDNPRYEGATIIQNAKKKNADNGGIMKEKRTFKFLGKKQIENQEPEEDKKDEVINSGDYVEIGNSEKVPVEELIENWKNRKNAENNESGNLLNAEDEVDIDGQKVKVSELVQAYSDKPSCENAETPINDDAEEVVDEAKQMQNSKPKKPVKNDNFKKVENAAHIDAAPGKPNICTKEDRLKRGKERYSKGAR
jgi:hypothetical protein